MVVVLSWLWYVNRCVKVRDLMGIVNFNLFKRGKLLVKFVIIVLNRLRVRDEWRF